MPHLEPLSPSDLIFSEASKNISSTLTTLRRSNLSISNRLQSIKHDTDFVQRVADAYQLPLVANERCGSWYIPPSRKAGSAYFKSTDGHFGQWSFSQRRLNLQILNLIAEHGGCIIVDSTRRGKSMPDALSKTIPIWIAVLNRVLCPDKYDSHSPKTPEDVVSSSEHSQIEARLSGFITELKDLDLDLGSLRSKLADKPLEPLWVTPDSTLPHPSTHLNRKNRHYIVLCTASGRSSTIDRASSDYVQGAADDSESWACGLTPSKFWTYQHQLLSTSGDSLTEVISKLLSDDDSLPSKAKAPVVIKPTTLVIANNATAELLYNKCDIIVSCSTTPSEFLADESRPAHYVHLACSTGKVGSRQLRSQLPKLEVIRGMLMPTARVFVTCTTGQDLAIGVALAIVCLFCREDGRFEPAGTSCIQSKQMIKKRLSWITTSMPEASPSRATLQSVNAFLLGPAAPR